MKVSSYEHEMRMENVGFEREKKLCLELHEFSRYCSCGCVNTVYPTMKKDYVICKWCHKKVFLDLEKQKEYDKKVEMEDFRIKLRKASKSQK